MTYEAHTQRNDHNLQSPIIYGINSLYATLHRVNPWQDCEMTEAGPRDPRRIQFSAHTWRTCRPSCVCSRVYIHACIIRTTRWKRMDKEGRGQEPWTTFQYVCSIDPRCITFDTGAVDTSLHSCIRKICVQRYVYTDF